MRTTSSDRFAFASALVIALSLAPNVAHADTDEQKAVALFEKGRKLARDGRCAEAIAPLQESIRYAEGVGTLLNLGNCYETLGKTASAHRAFLRAQEVAAKNDDRRKDEARERARSVEKEVSSLQIHVPVTMKGADVRVDGEPWPRERWDVPWPIDPGIHEVELLSATQPKQTDSVTVKPHGDHAEWAASLAKESATLQPAPSAALHETPRNVDKNDGREESSSQRTLGLVTGGAGALGLAAGTVFGIISISAHSALIGRCATYPKCDSNDRVQLDNMNHNAQLSGTVSTIGIIAGLVLVAAGAGLYFTAPKPSPRDR